MTPPQQHEEEHNLSDELKPDKLDYILHDLVQQFSTMRADYLHPGVVQAEAKKQILALIQEAEREAYKKGYAAGGVEEILRHNEAAQAVYKQLDNEGGDN